MRWLLLSDLHFKHHDLDRVWQTAQWIVSAAERNKVGRVVVCGDLLTSRTMQPTHVLSACYRFIGLLSDVVPRIHIVLGNHDLAYRRDYQTTALDALNISRLAPFVSLHSGIAHDEWDGRRVLLLPFREEQDELIKTVAALRPDEAINTVAFAHLAINKAITQRHVVSTSIKKPGAVNSITYRGLTGPDHFASLARTFTGHFHSHQTITQDRSNRHNADLQGSITYLGSPLQLGWADLNDEQRGVVLFDPETLEHEILINPHAVGYTTTDLQQVLEGQVDQEAMVGKHVMLLGELSRLKYVSARDKLLSLGVRSVRSWTPMGFFGGPSFGGLGASVPAGDVPAQVLDEPSKAEPDSDTVSDSVSGSSPVSEPRAASLTTEARQFVEELELDESLLSRREELVRVGQRIIQASHETIDMDSDAEVDHRQFLGKSSQITDMRATTNMAGPSNNVFTAEPRTLTITNFLGVQGTITIDFRQDLRRGLTFLVGDNGSGKSTLVEAMVWCQFGRCIRSGLAVGDVVNDSASRNCSVVLEFANGYAIARHRKHKSNGNRVVVSLRGEPQPQLEHPDTRTTQAAIDELLGIDYETYVRTVVLGHESTASFLTSTPAQRRDLIESSLGLSILDRCGQVSKLLLKGIDKDLDKVEGKLAGLLQTMEYIKQRLEDLGGTQKRLKEEVKEAEEAVASLEMVIQEHAAAEIRLDAGGPPGDELTRVRHGRSEFDADVADGRRNPLTTSERTQGLPTSARANINSDVEISTLQDQIYVERENLGRLESSYALIQEQEKHTKSASWLDWLRQQQSQTLGAEAATHTTGLHKFLSTMKTSLLGFRLLVIKGLLYIFGIPKDSSRGSAQGHSQAAAISSLQKNVKNSMSRLQNLGKEVDRIMTLEDLAINHIVKVKEQLTQAIQAQEASGALKQQVALKQRDTATYTRLVETEQSSLQLLLSEHDALTAERKELADNRELFVFWSSNLAKRTRRASSPSSAKSRSKATTNFREYVLVKPLSELNELLARILTALYDNKRSARVVAAGMLRSLLEPDYVDDGINISSSGSVLGPTLAVHHSLAYGKRSGGERKRVDLALFFALMQLMWARSAHRAHYMLVDEVFDSLDEEGQVAVVKWCGLMSQSVAGWIVVITHSQFLVEQNLGEDAGKAWILRAKMGQAGTELDVDGRRIGVHHGG